MRTHLAVGILLSTALAAQSQPPPFGTVHTMLPAWDTSGPMQSAASADLDGDGDLDLLVGVSLSQSDRVWLNDGNGVFVDVSATHWPGDRQSSTSIALGDVDGDGDVDAWVTQLGSRSRLYLNDGTARFTDVTTTHLPTGGRYPNDVALADVDGDGDLDAVVAQGSTLSDELFVNDGTGHFRDESAIRLPRDSAATRTVQIADLDGDGDLDLMLAFYQGPTRLYRNDGAGRFVDTVGWLPSGVGPNFDLGDADGDGDPDLLVGVTGQNRLYRNDGNDTFTDVTAASLPTFVDTTGVVQWLDADGDGDLDALFMNVHPEPSRLVQNDGTGVFVDAGPVGDPPVGSRRVVVADVDADRDVDLLPVSSYQAPRLLLNDGLGTFVDVNLPEVPSTPTETFSIALGDVDGDGDLDALLGNGEPWNAQPNELFRFDHRSGRFVDSTATSLPGVYDETRAVLLGDVDGDGDLDALIGNASPLGPSTLLLYDNDGSGVFTDLTAARMPALLDVIEDLAIGDLDRDGDLDLWAAGPRSLVLRNDGAGRFVEIPNAVPPSPPTIGVQLGDVDGDGDLDAFAVTGTAAVVFRNDGTGRFAAAPIAGSPRFQRPRIVLGDLDGDRDLDAAVGGGYGDTRVFRNDGAAGFVDVTAAVLPSGGVALPSLALGDVDLDGDLDLLVTRERIYRNDGTGRFSLEPSGGTAGIWDTHILALADVDADGDLDAYATGLDPGGFFPGLARHLAWSGIPRLGKPLDLDLFGPGGPGVFVLAVSPCDAWTPTPLGTFRLDPALVLVHAIGPLNGNGRARHTIPVPANASLLGVRLAWQALVGPPFGLTNLEMTILTGL